MLFLALLTLFVALATRVVAQTKDIITIPLTKRINPNGTFNVVKRDSMRASFLLQDGQLGQNGYLNTDIPLNDDQIDGAYTADVVIGDPAVHYRLSFDTGSSFTWVGANKSYVRTKTSVKTNDTFNITYGLGQARGTECIDTVAIAPGIVVRQQSIGVASNTTDILFDGILGFGLKNLTFGILFPDNSSVVPTIMDNLVLQGTIERNIFGVSFEPSNSTSLTNMNGELTVGDVDPTKYIGDITYHNIPTKYPANQYFSVDAVSVQYGNETILADSLGIVDTGTTLIGLNNDAYDRYVRATDAVYDNATQLLRISTAAYNELQPLVFTVGSTNYVLNANAQIYPRALNILIGGDSNHTYLAVFNIGNATGGNLTGDVILGMTFQQRYYTVYDTDYRRVGFANTRFTNATDVN